MSFNTFEDRKPKEDIAGAPKPCTRCFKLSKHEDLMKYGSFCKACYLQCMAGKTPVIELKNGLGKVTYNSKTMRIDFPSTVLASRLPQVKKEKANAGGKS